MNEDHSELFNEIQKFSQRKLKKVETKVVTGSGDKVTEKRTAKGLAQLDPNNQNAAENTDGPPRKLDLQVGMVMPGLMIGSNDVAQDQKTLNEFSITHILNLAPDETQKFRFEDDFNYLEVRVRDEQDFSLRSVLDQCFDFIDEGRFRGNCLVHCCTVKPGLSRSTALCIAYMIKQEKKSFDEAFNDVKEARAFVRPGEWFVKQLKEYSTEINEAAKDEKPAEDKFTAKKKAEIEEEKAMLKNAVNIKNKMNMWDKAAEEQQRKLQESQMRPQRKFGSTFVPQENEIQSNIRTNDGQAPRKLTSIVSIFQNKPAETSRPASKIVLNSAPAKKWAPVNINSLQRTIKPDARKFEDFSAKVKRSKSREWKRDALKRTKSKSEDDTPAVNPSQPTPQMVKNLVRNGQVSTSVPPPPPPPPPPMMRSQAKPIPPPVSAQSKPFSTPSPSVSPVQRSSITPIVTPTPTQKSTSIPPPPPPKVTGMLTKSNNGPIFNKPSPPPTLARSLSPVAPPPPPDRRSSMGGVGQPNFKLDPSKLRKFSGVSAMPLQNPCVDYNKKAAAAATVSAAVTSAVNIAKPVERTIPIRKEPSTEEEDSEEEVDLEAEEESSEEESSEEESSSEESSSEEEPQIEAGGDAKGLTRSSTMEILKLIKAKNNDNEKLQVVEEEDEDKEIDLLLIGLQNEGVENIDWGEFGIELSEVKDIIQNNRDDDEEESEEDEEESDDE